MKSGPSSSQPYHSLEAELHDAFWDAEDASSEIPLMANFLQKHPGPALEIGSGSGRLMFPLVKAGFEIEGLELSTDMRSLGKVRAQKLGVNPTVHSGDMSDWRPPHSFAALLAPAFTLQLAADPSAVLHHWHGWLQNHGGLYLTVFMPYAELLGDLPENEWYPDHQATLPDGRLGELETRHRLDRAHQMIHREHRYSVSGNPPLHYQSRQSIRWIEHSEMLEMLKNTGFRLDRFYLDFDPNRQVENLDDVDFDGILTYEITRID